MTEANAPGVTAFASIAVDTMVLPGRRRPTAVIRLGCDQPRRPVLWTRRALSDFAAAAAHVGTLDVEAVVIIGNEHSFGSGADVGELASATSVADAEAIAHEGWRAFRSVAALPVPSFALITGYALGGGLELALFADHRVARSDVRGIGLPEVGLGILPGWGGAYRLTRLAGPKAAIGTAIEDSRRRRMLGAAQAAERGIVDAVLPDADWDAAWPQWVAARVDAGRRQPGTLPSCEEWDRAVAAASNRWRSGRAPVGGPAEATLALIARAREQDLDDAEAATCQEFGRLLYSDAARASIYAHGLTVGKPAVPAGLQGGRARPITRAAVLGAGLMASQLATLIARHARIPVVLTDLDQQRAEHGLHLVRDRLDRLAARGALTAAETEEVAALVSATADPAGIADADLVIEAIYEDLDAKRRAFADAEARLVPGAILATNTSSLSVTRMAEGLRHPERVIGFHVFNPVEVVPLLELVPGAATGPDTVATALEFASRLRRSVVCSGDAPGFIVNRVLTRLLDVVLRAIDSGQDPVAADHALDLLGLPMTPLQLVDFIGPAVQLHICETLQAAFPDRFARPRWLARVVEAGQRTVLAGDGSLGAVAALLLPNPAAAPEPEDQLREGVVLAVADEIRRMLDDGVVAEPAEVDFALLLGANWPRDLGGITPYLDRIGAAERATGRRFHPAGTVTLPSSISEPAQERS